MPRTYATRIHLVERRGTDVTPACGSWSRSVNWTTEARVATCPECLARARAAPATTPPALRVECSACGRVARADGTWAAPLRADRADATHTVCPRCMNRLWNGSSPTPLVGSLRPVQLRSS